MVDKTKLTRDYETTPLKRGEYPNVEDVRYLFIECGLSREETANICCCNSEKIKFVCRKNKIQKTKEQRNSLRKRTNLSKYGVANVSQLQDIKEKKEQTCLKNYGVKSPAKSHEVNEKRKETCLKRYGTESPNSVETHKQKVKETCFRKYGVNNVMKDLKIKEKQMQTCIEKYGAKNVILNEEIRQKKENTCMEKYGKPYVYGTPYFKEKSIETNQLKYNVSNIMDIFNSEDITNEALKIKQKIIDNIPNMVKKCNETKRKNKSFNTSKIEKELFYLLKKKFSETIHNYSEHPIYTFACDYYIPELDLLIEYNGIWTHGKEPFDSNNPEHIEKLRYWEERALTSNYYKNAIYTWTDLDVRKQKIARENHLNYLVFYSKEEFMEWYNELK